MKYVFIFVDLAKTKLEIHRGRPHSSLPFVPRHPSPPKLIELRNGLIFPGLGAHAEVCFDKSYKDLPLLVRWLFSSPLPLSFPLFFFGLVFPSLTFFFYRLILALINMAEAQLHDFPSLFSLKGKVAVVTGGSRGLGLHAASAYVLLPCLYPPLPNLTFFPWRGEKLTAIVNTCANRVWFSFTVSYKRAPQKSSSRRARRRRATKP